MQSPSSAPQSYLIFHAPDHLSCSVGNVHPPPRQHILKSRIKLQYSMNHRQPRKAIENEWNKMTLKEINECIIESLACRIGWNSAINVRNVLLSFSDRYEWFSPDFESKLPLFWWGSLNSVCNDFYFRPSIFEYCSLCSLANSRSLESIGKSGGPSEIT